MVERMNRSELRAALNLPETTQAGQRISREEYKILSGQTADPAKAKKYRNRKTMVDGILFDSKKEADRWCELRALERAGRIHDLRRQVRFQIAEKGGKGTRARFYVADFVYQELGESSWVEVVEDVKSEITRRLPLYTLKKQLMMEIHGITIREI